jgi:hypothetical protein
LLKATINFVMSKMISAFRRDVQESCTLLGYYAA